MENRERSCFMTGTTGGPPRDWPVLPQHIEAVFQPIVDLAEGEIAGFEALSRPTAASPFTGAGPMFDWAQEHGTLWALEEITRAKSLSAARDWPAGVKLFLNTSPQVFADPRFADTIVEAVRAVPGLTPGRVVLEITERSEQQHTDALEEQVRRAKSHGFQIAIDDVGAGTSGFNRIMSLRPNWLKLDRALIDRIDQDRTRQNLLRFFLHFARLSGVQLVAEGIERETELATLVELGIPFGQGYFLACPGDRGQTVAPELAQWLRRRWSGADTGRYRDPRRVLLQRFARPAQTVTADEPVREIAGRLLRQPGAPGVAVMEGRRYAGWCDRDQVLRAAGDSRAGQPIGFLVGPDPVAASAETTVAEAVDLALARDERSAAAPLVILDKGEVTGMLTVRDLLHAAAEMIDQGQGRTAPITGLPGRVRCDEHVAGLIARRTSSVGPPQAAHDAAFIDIRNFHDYNGAYGYELGDQLLRRLAMMLQTLLAKEEPGVFIGHLGDDRFVVTAPAGVLRRRLERLAAQFERSTPDFLADGPAGERAGTIGRIMAHGPARIGLRVVLLREPFSRVATARDLYALAKEEACRADPDGTGPVLIDAGAPRQRRLSA